MKVRSILVLGVAVSVMLIAVNSFGAWVTNLWGDVFQTRYSPRITFTPLSTPVALPDGGTDWTILDVPRFTTPTNGIMRVWLVGGLYRVEFPEPNRSIKILVPPNDTNVYHFNTLANLATNVGTFQFTNVRGRISAAVRAGNGITITTNNAGLVNEYITIAAQASGQTNISYTAVTNAPWALTNSPTLFSAYLFNPLPINATAHAFKITNFYGDAFIVYANSDSVEVHGVMSAALFVGDGSELFNLPAPPLSSVLGAGNDAGSANILGVGKALLGSTTSAADARVQIFGSGANGQVGVYYKNSSPNSGFITYVGVGNGDSFGLYSYTLGADVFVFDAGAGGKVGIMNSFPEFTLDVGGNAHVLSDLLVEGKITGNGGFDPPYLLLDANTRGAVKGRVLAEVAREKQSGGALYFNSAVNRLEVYVASQDKFYDLNGQEILTGIVQAIAPLPRTNLATLRTNFSIGTNAVSPIQR